MALRPQLQQDEPDAGVVRLCTGGRAAVIIGHPRLPAMVGSTLLLWWLFQSAGPAAAAAQQHSQQQQWEALAAGGDTLVPMIVVLARHQLLRSHFHHCAAAPAGNVSSSSPPAACALLRGACSRVFDLSASLTGLAGVFDRRQYDALHSCAGQGGVLYVARDGQVTKAEGSRLAYVDWATHRAPGNLSLAQLQQLVAARLATAAAAGVARAAASVAGPDERSGSFNSTLRDAKPPLTLLQRWLRAEVGLAAQQRLQEEPRGSMISSSTTMAATQQGAMQASDGGADTSAQQSFLADTPPNSKNQDPGIFVDLAAVASPGITLLRNQVESAASRSSQSAPPGASAASASWAGDVSSSAPLPAVEAERANQAPGTKVQSLVSALWGLDRIDARLLPLDGRFQYGSSAQPGTGRGVTIYVLDSGILASHQEFARWGSRESRATAGPDFVTGDGRRAEDCDGHGTHVASTAAGRSVGVAKEATVVALRVLDCEGAGSISNVVAALDWVVQHAAHPAVVSLSLGVSAGAWTQPLEDAVRAVLAKKLTVVVAAGNSAKDSCSVSPGRVHGVINVAASNLPNKFGQTAAGDAEDIYSWSNTGECVTLFAPGVDVFGACGGASRCQDVNGKTYSWASGTSMAAPHVSGVAAVYLEAHPNAGPEEVAAALVAAATQGRLQQAAMLPGTPNRLVFSGGGDSGGVVEASG